MNQVANEDLEKHNPYEEDTDCGESSIIFNKKNKYKLTKITEMFS